MLRIIAVCFLFHCPFAFGQVVHLVDQDSDPISSVKVLITDSDNQLLAITYTDSIGIVKYDFKLSARYNLETAHPSFKSKKIQVTFSYEEKKIFTLDRVVEPLSEVLLVAKKSIVRRGDTTIIDVKKFALPTDKNIKQVISRIPGMEISRNGDITYKGKKITDLLVNGRKLFDQDYNRAIDFINSEKAIELKVIEKYNDNHGFKKHIINSNAIDIKFEGKTIYTSQLLAGYGNDETKKADYGHIYVNRILSNYTRTSYNNLGIISFSPTTNNVPRKRAIFQEIVQNQNHGNSLNDIYGNFVDQYAIDVNTNVPLVYRSEDRPLTIKVSRQIENSNIDINSESILFNEDSPISRSEQINSNFDSDSYSILASHKYKAKKFYLNGELFLSKGISNRRSRNLINEFLISDRLSNQVTQALLNTTIQFKKDEKRFHDFNFLIAAKTIENKLESIGINEFNQNINGHFFYLNAKYNYSIINNKKFEFGVSSNFDNLKSEYNNKIAGNSIQNFTGNELNTIWLTQLTGSYKPTKKFQVDLTLNNTNLLFKNQDVDNDFNLVFPNPNLRVFANFFGIKNIFQYSNTYSRISNRVSNRSLIFNANTNSEAFDISNPFQESHEFKYVTRWGDYIDSWNSSISYSTRNNLLISDFSFTENSTNILYFNKDLTEQQLYFQLSRDFLFLKKFNIKIGVDHMITSGFQSSESVIASLKNKNTSLNFEASKRLGKKWFFRTQSIFSLNDITFNNSFTNRVFNLSTNLDLEYVFKESTAQIHYKLNDFGLNNYLHFLNAEYTFNLDKWSSSFTLNAINLLNVESIDIKNISAQSSFTSLQAIPGRRFLFSWRLYL